MLSAIFLPIGILAGLGLIAGIGLSVASVYMYAKTDDRAENVAKVLPGINCGACGFSGCLGYAQALVDKKSKNGLCVPGGSEVSKAIAKNLGVEVADVACLTAVVHCAGTHDNTSDKLEYHGVNSCLASMQLYGGFASCSFGCIGLGDCESVCQYGAIKVCNGVAMVNRDLCSGCSMCVRSCPKGIISLEPFGKTAVYCTSRMKGRDKRKFCSAGCLGCYKCSKVCPENAITVDEYCAHVDSSKCTGCGECIQVCPTGIVRYR